MKSYIKKEFLNLEKKIIKRFESQKKNELSAKILINYLIYLNLKTEVLVFTKDHNPEVEILNEIKYLYSLVNQISTFKEFASNKVKIQNFILEFNKVWLQHR